MPKVQADKARRFCLGLIAVGQLTFCPVIAQADDANDEAIIKETADINAKEVTEAEELFKIVRDDPALLNDRQLFRQCEYLNSWSQEPIPEYIARAEFGLKLHTDLLGPDRGKGLKEFLERKESDSGAFCSLGETSKLDAERLKDFASSSQKTMSIDHGSFGFPVFDSAYDKALIVIMHSSVLVVRDSLGFGKKLPPNVVTFAAVFEKRYGRWRKTKTIPISVS